MNRCVRCSTNFVGRYPNSKICKACSKRGMSRGVGHWNYQHGKYTYHTFAKEIRDARVSCECCGKFLLDASRWHWVVHHKDHNQINNDVNNLELLCKQCHQIEHECWLAFEGATTRA